MTDPLFPVLTNFYIGAFQTAISEASQLTGLSQEQKLQREIFTHRAYIEIGSYDVRSRCRTSERLIGKYSELAHLPFYPFIFSFAVSLV